MTCSLFLASMCLLSASAYSVNSVAQPPEVIIQRSAFDYPPNFLEVYNLAECTERPA